MKKLTRILALTLCCLLAAGLAACGETPAHRPCRPPDQHTCGDFLRGLQQFPGFITPY